MKLAKPEKKYKLQSCILSNPQLFTNQQCRTDESNRKAEAEPRENEEAVAIIQFSICDRANKRWSVYTSTRRVYMCCLHKGTWWEQKSYAVCEHCPAALLQFHVFWSNLHNFLCVAISAGQQVYIVPYF